MSKWRRRSRWAVLRVGSVVVLAGLSVAGCSDQVLTEPERPDADSQLGSTAFATAAVQPDNVRVAFALTPSPSFTPINTKGNYVAAGDGLRGLTSGSISISGIPAGATVNTALLYWGMLDNGESASLKSLTFNGTPITGTLIGSGGDTCWGRTNSFAYRADVTSLVAGNGASPITGVASGGAILAQGASLIVVYDNASDPVRVISLIEGDDVINSGGASFTNSLSLGTTPVGITAGAKTTFVVGDGQGFSETVSFTGGNGTAFFNNSLNGSDGAFWDTDTHDVSGQVAVGDASVSAFMGINGGDCLMWVAQVFSAIVRIKVDIDIKPCVNNDGNGVIPVWIFGAADFDVAQVDPSTVQLEGLSVASQGKSGKLMARVAHVNGDEFADLIVRIEDVDGTFTSGNGTATLTGNLFDGTPFEGSDDICVVPPARPDEEAPVISGLQPPDETPLFVWNPDLLVDYSLGGPFAIDASRACGPGVAGTGVVAFPPDPTECETLMFEAVDLGTGVEEVGCVMAYPNTCDDANGDGNFIVAGIVDGPATCDGGAGCDDELLITDDAGTAGNGMFQAYFCDGSNVGAPNCDGTDDGVYTARVLVSDQASPQNNVATVDYPFVLDTHPPVIAFFGLSGLQASNAASVEFVLDASVVDRNGDGTAVTSATVEVTIETTAQDGICGTGDELAGFNNVLVTPPANNNPASTAPVIVNVTGQVNANQGDFSVTFTAQNQGGNLGLGDYTYCFEVVADDGAERKDGSDDGLAVSAAAGKDFNWQ